MIHTVMRHSFDRGHSMDRSSAVGCSFSHKKLSTSLMWFRYDSYQNMYDPDILGRDKQRVTQQTKTTQIKPKHKVYRNLHLRLRPLLMINNINCNVLYTYSISHPFKPNTTFTGTPPASPPYCQQQKLPTYYVLRYYILRNGGGGA